MLEFINNQADWYKEKQKSIEKARTAILKESAYGRYILALRREKAFNTAKNIYLMTNIIAANFNPNHFDMPEVKRANKIIESLSKLFAEEVSFRRKQVYPKGGFQSEFQTNNTTKKEFIFNHKKQ